MTRKSDFYVLLLLAKVNTHTQNIYLFICFLFYVIKKDLK